MHFWLTPPPSCLLNVSALVRQHTSRCDPSRKVQEYIKACSCTSLRSRSSLIHYGSSAWNQKFNRFLKIIVHSLACLRHEALFLTSFLLWLESKADWVEKKKSKRDDQITDVKTFVLRGSWIFPNLPAGLPNDECLALRIAAFSFSWLAALHLLSVFLSSQFTRSQLCDILGHMGW